jgi:hypothetical protein
MLQTKPHGLSCVLLGVSMLAMVAGCESSGPAQNAAPSFQLRSGLQAGQQTFASETDAVTALVTAAKTQDMAAIDRIFGPSVKDLKSGDAVQDASELKALASHAAENTRTEGQSPNRATLYLGKDQWPFPVPLVKTEDGKWFFDVAAGQQEILARRIGKNELATIRVCRAYVDAQRQYASKERDDSGVLKYAQRLVSTTDEKDGLYWPAAPGETQSPFGPLAAQASLEGYSPDTRQFHRAYHGYYLHVLKQQGSAAPGGEYNYVINGNMIAGFALVACPDKYGASGVMTFIVNQQGKVYQKDLGPDTLEIVRGMKQYNPDSTWTLVKD